MRRSARVGILMLVMCAGAHAQVELRTREHVEGAVEDATVAALKIAPQGTGSGPRLISWDRVGKIDGAAAAKAKPFEPVMDQLWRARTRIERGDFLLAEPLVDQLQRTYGAEEGPSAALVAECLLRCRLARGAQGAATTAWLWLSGLTEKKAAAGAPGKLAPVWIGGTTDLPPIIDAGTQLAPSVPPIWTPGAAAQSAATAVEWTALQARGGNTGLLATMYEKAVRFEAGLDAEIILDDYAGADPAVSIVRDIVLARGGDEEDREAARQSILKRLAMTTARPDPTKPKTAPMPVWLEAWLRIGLGRSMIREADNSVRVRGVIELLHIPARFGVDQPHLAGLALADAAVTMSEVGDTDAAAALKAELTARYPTHPVLAWDALSKVTAKTNAAEGRRLGAASESDTNDRGIAAHRVRSPRRDTTAVIQKGPA